MPHESSFSDQADPGLFLRYLEGTATPAEREVAEQMAGLALSSVPADPSLAPVAPDVDAEWRALAIAISQQNDETGPVATTDPASSSSIPRRHLLPGITQRRPRARWGMAAAAVALIGIGGLWIKSASVSHPHSITREYTTERAQQATFTLPDGTEVVLAPATRLSFAVDRDGHRTVQLDGQAYFTVTHDPGRPFQVLTRGVATKVLGTAFSVRSYPSDPAMQVAVAAGKVAVETGVSPVIVLPGDVIRAQPGESPIHATDARIADVLGWMQGKLSFDDQPLANVIRDIERYYDITVEVTDRRLLDRSITVTVGTKSADVMLQSIAFALNAKYTHRGSTVVLSPL